MASKASIGDRLHYRIDSFLARGSAALFFALVITFVGSIIVIAGLRALIHIVVPDPGNDLLRQTWITFLQLTDPGNMSQDNDTPTTFKIASVIAGLTGVVIFSALIAFLTTALDQAIASLKRGHSRVLEEGHTLILGWGPRVLEILKELVEANESEDDPVVVILSDVEKEEMDEFLRTHFTDRRNTRLVTRSGPTSSLASLRHVNAASAKSAIILASAVETDAPVDKQASDARGIKTVLALEALAPEADFVIVAELFEKRNRDVVVEMARGRVSVLDAPEILAKVMVQTSRTSGLSTVYAELLSFEGCEMYFHGNPGWKGTRFGTLQYHFSDGVPIGLRRADGSLLVRPPPDEVCRADDEILIIADDDSTIHFENAPVMQPRDLPLPARRVEQVKERKLIIGWSPKTPIIISEYNDYVLEGSEVHIMLPAPPPELMVTLKRLDDNLGNITIRHINRDPLDIRHLASVRPFGYNNVTILPLNPHPGKDAERIDAETLIILLHLRRLSRVAESHGESVQTKLVTEVLDSSNQELVAQAGVDDFIISNRMVSMLFAQISEEPDIQKVYDDLFAEDGSEIYVKPAWLYFEEFPVDVRFGDLMRLAQKRDGEVCIGYKLKALEDDADANYGVELIPPKDTSITLQAEDALVVVAEDDR